MKGGAVIRARASLLLLSIGFLALPGLAQGDDLSLDLSAMAQNIEELRRREHSLAKFLDKSKSESDTLEARVIARGRAYYRITRGLPQGDPFEHAVVVERVRLGLLKDLERVKLLTREARRSERQLTLVRQRRIPLEAEEKARGQVQEALLAQKERQRAFELAFSSGARARGHTAVYGAVTPLGYATESFRSLRGQLPLPVPGRAEIAEVKRPFAAGPGLSLQVNLGTPARAVFPGRVAFADSYAEYGQTVILDHGDGYFTVSAQLSTVEVRVGDELPAGARLGVIGGGGPMAELYFEIRLGQETLDPGDWFGI